LSFRAGGDKEFEINTAHIVFRFMRSIKGVGPVFGAELSTL
jgi:hypothetical protein